MSEARAAAALVNDAARIVVLTGAGMSAESGVPTFRDAQTGLWARFDQHELATPEAFLRRPGLVFGWYLWRTRQVGEAVPHAGYDAIVQLERRKAGAVTVVTQNVDGMHARAGSTGVVELHGSLVAYRCFRCDHPFSLDGLPPGDADEAGEVLPPACGKCGNFIRPGVVWFGEALPVGAVERAWRAAAQADVAVVVGTSSLVYPAAELPAVVKGAGGRIVEINPQETPLSRLADVYWPDTAARALPALVAALDHSPEE